MAIASTPQGQMSLAGILPTTDQPFHTDNPRYIRMIRALAVSPRTREELDSIAGASNSPDAIKAIRSQGLVIPVCRERVLDRDGSVVCRGRYHFTDSDLQRTRFIWEV